MSTFGFSEAPTQDTQAGYNGTRTAMTASNAQAISHFRNSKFEENEKSVTQYPFKTFYTSGEPVLYHKENRFEAKSNYLSYYPSGMTCEQEMEQVWFDHKNKELNDKRREEE